LDHSLFNLELLQYFTWCLFPLGPLPVQPWVATVLHVVLVPSWTTLCSALGCYSTSRGACSLLDHSLFSLGLLRCFMWCLFPLGPLPVQPWVALVLHVVLIPSWTTLCSVLGCYGASCGALPSLTTPCSALGYWHCFIWCLFPL
jgi:hypothetical protein